MDSDNKTLTIITTADNSRTIYNPIVDENYHSMHGAVEESNHVFLNSGLRYFLADNESKRVSVLEVGFGTGLNFLLTADFCTGTAINLNYVGIEAFPLEFDFIEHTNYHELVSQNTWQGYKDTYSQALERFIPLNNFCNYHIAYTELMNFSSDELFDVIYFDAFASKKQPEMWSAEAITHTVSFLKPGGVFVTYAITGDLKRIMKSLGMKVEKAPGSAGKREMLRAIKI
ncbi:tRNA (5-methylaminomethyl-2-thiouridine)(34)-methyltransferase MnmD [Pseudopedobacter sp.]|uniref:tRNA (5-methylaminomethyl-2-thiouridine)(34)-methyltransferase MnmD n=1 Tax=Pseudopedobacter sp. TaxID=1936787 RepID=UPI00334135BF